MSRDYDPHDLAGQRDREERLKVLERERADNLIADVKWLMSGPRGRRFLRVLLDETGVPHGDAFSSDALVMARETGRHSVGRWIYSLVLNHAADLFPLMLKEANDDSSRTTDGQ